jgi:hypothetical protein
VDIGNGKAAELTSSVLAMVTKVLVVQLMGHGAIGRVGDKIDVLWDGSRLVGNDLDHVLVGLSDTCPINLDLNCIDVDLGAVFSIQDILGDKTDTSMMSEALVFTSA